MQSKLPQFGQGLDHAGSPTMSAGLGQVPLFHAAWLFAAGITLAHWLYLRPSLLLISLGLFATLCGVAAFRAQRIVWLPLAALWCLLGSWCAEMEPGLAPAPTVAILSDGLLRTVEGTVVDASAFQRSNPSPTTSMCNPPLPEASA